MRHTGLSRHGAQRRRWSAVAVASTLLIAACSSDSKGSSGATATTSSGSETTAASGSTSPADTSVGGSTTTVADLLGPSNPATGDPVKIGIVSVGKSDVQDLSIESTVADATASYLNEHQQGIGGHPIEMDTCITGADAAKASDCANQLIQDGVAAVVMGNSGNIEQVWPPLHDAKIPTILYGAAGAQLFTDTQSTFILANSLVGLGDLPISAAKDAGAKKVTIVVVDVPSATGYYTSLGQKAFGAAGLEMQMVAIPMGTADMVPQMQEVVAGNPGVVHVVGNDAFCIAAFNGLHSAGYTGKITTVSQCVTQATITAVPGEVLKGIVETVPAPLGSDDPGIKRYEAVVKQYADGSVDLSDAFGVALYTTLTALSEAMQGVSDVTPASIISTLKAMPEMELPASGGVNFRCNGKAISWAPALCARAGLVATLDDKGQPASYSKVSDTPIEG